MRDWQRKETERHNNELEKIARNQSEHYLQMSGNWMDDMHRAFEERLDKLDDLLRQPLDKTSE